MKENSIDEDRRMKAGKFKALFMMILAMIIASTFLVYAMFSGSFGFSMVLMSLAAVLLLVFGLFALRRYRDAGRGIPFEDERSRRVMEKAGYLAFLITLYVLLAVGLLSDDLIHFRDVSQATSAVIGIMALVFFGSWFYYNRKGI
jgi:uncharacterized membrane protein